LANENDAAFGNGQVICVEMELDGQSAQTLAPPMLGHCALAETGLNMLLVDGGHEPSEFASQDGGILEAVPEQQRLKPAVEVFDRAIALGPTLGDEDGRHAQAQTQSDDA